LRQQIHDLNYKYPELTMGITGRPVLQNDEANSTQSDSQIAGLLSFILVALLFLIFFRSYKRSLFSLLSLLIGIAWTTGFVSLIYGSINLITIVFAVILIGLGIDYGIHFLIRYQNEKYDGAQTTDAIKTTTLHTGSAIFFGALTSAIAFGTALLTDFLGLQQLGLIAGVGIILCCLSQLLVFPSLLNLFDHKKLKQSYKIPSFKKLEFLTSKPILVIAVAFLITVASLPFAFKTGFNNNILEMQDPNLESVKFEKLIQDNSDISTWFLSYKTKDLAELKKIKSEIEKLKTVKKTDSILNIVPSNQIERITILKNSLNKFQDQALLEYSSPSLTKALTTLIQNIDNFANKAFKNGLVEEFNELDQLSKNLRKILNNPDPIYGQEFINIIKSAQYLFANLLKPKIIDENKIPDELLSLYKSQNGFYSLTIFPKKDIWNPDNMEEFIQDVRHIIPNVTGAPITSYESAKRLVDGFVLVAILTALLVLTIVYFEFKNIKITLIIFFNLIISIIWLGAFMDFNNIPINLANFFALPVLIGSGIDHGIHIFHRYRESGSVTDLYRSTIPAVTLSCLTTIFGFASLSFVHHKGLASFGFILAIGTGLIMLSSIILLPNVIKFLEKEQEYDLWPETEPSIKTMAP